MRLPAVFIPATVIVFALLTFPLREAFNLPAAQLSFADAASVDESQVRTAEMIVQGVKCKGTANFFLARYEGEEGILDLEAYAADHKVIVTYDASKIGTDRIQEIGNAPVEMNDGEHRTFFVVEKLTEQ